MTLDAPIDTPSAAAEGCDVATVPDARERARTQPRQPGDGVSPPGTDIDAPSRTPVRRRLAAWISQHGVVVLAAIVLVVPVVVAGIWALLHPWTPAGDWALMELRVRDVGTDTPLVGPYSRYGWSHPGPLLFYLLVVPYRLLGENGSALLAATALINVACLVGMVVVARRRGGNGLALLTVLAAAFLLHSLHPGFTWDPWNPYVTLLPFALFLLLAWSVSDGDRAAAPFAAVVGTFLVQSHIGYLALVGLIGCWAAASFTWIELRRRPMRLPRRARTGRLSRTETDLPHTAGPDSAGPASAGPDSAGPDTAGPDSAEAATSAVTRSRPSLRLGTTLLAVVAVVAVTWAPVAVGELQGDGNVGRIIHHFSGDQNAVGVTAALPITAQELGRSDPPWIGGPEDRDPHGGGLAGRDLSDLAWPLAGFALAAALAGYRAVRRPDLRRRLVGALRLQATALAAASAGFYATARVTDTVYGYVVRWWWAIGLLWWLSCAWSVVSSISPDWRRHLRWVAVPAGALAVLQLTIGVLVLLPTSPYPSADLEGSLGSLSAAAIRGTTRSGPIIVRSEGSFEGNLADAMRNELDRAGFPVVVNPEDAYKYGSGRSADRRPPVATLWVVRVDAVHEFEQRTDLCELAKWDPLTPPERASYREKSTRLRVQLLAAGREDLADALARQSSLWDAHGMPGVDQDALNDVEQVRKREAQVAIFLGPPPDEYRTNGPATGIDAPGRPRACPQMPAPPR